MNKIISYGKRLARRVLLGSPTDAGTLVGDLVWNKVVKEPHLQLLVDEMSDEQARLHFGEEQLLESEHFRRVVQYFHACESIHCANASALVLPMPRSST